MPKSVFEQYCRSPEGQSILKKWNYLPPETERACPLCGCGEKKEESRFGPFRNVRCPECEMRYVSPRLSDRQLADYYASMYTDAIFQKDFEGKTHDVFGDAEERKRKIRDRHVEIELTRNFCASGRILDVGCGSGLYFEGLGMGYAFHGIECSPKAAGYAKRRFEAKILQKDIMEAEYPRDSFDVVNMTYVIEHLAEPRNAMKRVHGWLKPGGLLLVSSPNWNGPVPRLFGPFFRLNDPCQHINLWSPKTLKRLLVETGFRPRGVHYPYFKTEYFNTRELGRLFRNTLYRFLLPVFMKIGYFPHPGKVLSPPFRGNIMVIHANKD